jgi:penicillin-binding protein
MSENAEQDIEKLAELLGISVETVQKKLAAKWVKGDSLVPIKTIEKLDPFELSYYEPNQESLANEKLYNDLLKIPGVKITDVEVRTYPLKDKASHLTGYVQNITAEELEQHKGEGYSSSSVIGKSGLENLYEAELKGKDGYEVLVVTSDGREKETLALKTKEDGKDIVLTIDAKLQKALYDEFVEDESCSVAMNPRTGEVLALVSTPSFDANDFVLGLSDSKWTALNEDEKKPLWNRFRATWCPGSSFKSVVAAIGVSTNTLNPNEDFGNVGRSWQKDKSWGSYYVTTLHDYNDVRMENALIYSDNIYFAKAALKMGSDILIENLDMLGFGERVPFDIWMSHSQYANNKKIKTQIQLADTGYGQGQLLINPLHLASIYTAFVNSGSMVMPFLKYEKEKLPIYWKENVFTQEAVKLVKDALIQVVEDPHGSARMCKMDSITLAGKTGTAEIKASKEDTSGTELGWFAVFTPDKEVSDTILLITMVEDVKERGGSTYVVKKDKKILEQIYDK